MHSLRGTIIEVFEDMKSIGEKIAIILYDNGFATVNLLKKVDIKELTEIKGLKKVKSLLNWTNNHTISNQMDFLLKTIWDVFSNPYHV